MKRIFGTALICVCAAVFMFGCAIFKPKITRITDSSGYTADVASVRLVKHPKIKLDCGGARMEFLYSELRSVKILRRQIKSIDGRLYFGAQIELKDGTVYGKSQDKGKCYICSDNELAGTSSKSDYTVSFQKLESFIILDKGEE